MFPFSDCPVAPTTPPLHICTSAHLYPPCLLPPSKQPSLRPATRMPRLATRQDASRLYPKFGVCRLPACAVHKDHPAVPAQATVSATDGLDAPTARTVAAAACKRADNPCSSAWLPFSPFWPPVRTIPALHEAARWPDALLIASPRLPGGSSHPLLRSSAVLSCRGCLL